MNKWRIIPPVTDQKVKFVKLLILRGLYIGRQRYDPDSLQTGVDHIFTNGLFTDIRTSNPRRISMLATSGPHDSVRVIKKLQESPFFSQYFQDSLRRHPGGICGEAYVRLYDNQIIKTAASPPKRRFVLPKVFKMNFGLAKMERMANRIAAIEDKIEDGKIINEIIRIR